MRTLAISIRMLAKSFLLAEEKSLLCQVFWLVGSTSKLQLKHAVSMWNNLLWKGLLCVQR